MEYVEILSMILNSDDKLTKEYAHAIKGINTQFFIDQSMISDTCSFKNTGNGYISIYEDGGDIIMEYAYGGTGSIKSCTKLIEFVFNPNLKRELSNLKIDILTSDISKEPDRTQFCAVCRMYNLKRDPVDFNHITKTKDYTAEYYLRKMANNEYLLQAYLILAKPIIKNNHALTNLNLIFDIAPKYQNILKSYAKPLNTVDLNNQELNLDDYDDFDNLYNNYDDEFGENPFDTLSKLGPGTYNLEDGSFTPDDENIETDNDLFEC